MFLVKRLTLGPVVYLLTLVVVPSPHVYGQSPQSPNPSNSAAEAKAADDQGVQRETADGDTADRQPAEESIAEESIAEEPISEAPTTGGAITEPVTDADLELFELFVNTLDQVQRNYVRPVSRRELMDAAIEGVLAKLDSHSDYISPDEMPDFRREVQQQFGGIGIQLAVIDDVATITTPLLNSPAFRAGIKAGDIITHVQGDPVGGLNLDEVIEKLKGDLGTQVTLTIRSGNQPPRQVSLVRELVHVETVMALRREAEGRWDHLIDPQDQIGYVRITAFSATTADEVRAALAQLKARGAQALVLDLRFNPGGVLDAAVQVADMFLEEGKIVRTAGRGGITGEWKVAQANGAFEQVPLAVLINRFSASGSEIVAAALQDHGRAAIIGQRSWGKGSVQQLIPLEAGRSALKLTTSSYQRPSGRNIHRFEGATAEDEWGVEPDEGMKVELTFRQLQELLEFQQQAFVIAPDEPSPETFLDPQLDKAMDYLREQIEQ